MSHNEVIQRALEDLNSADAEVRATAIETVANYQHIPAVPQLIGILQDSDPGTRYLVANALGQIGDEQAVPALLEALSGRDTWVRVAATGALIRIGSASGWWAGKSVK